MGNLVPNVGSTLSPGSEALIGLTRTKIGVAARLLEEKFYMSPLLKKPDLHLLFSLKRHETEGLFKLFDPSNTGTVNAYEVLSVVYFTAEISLFERCKRLFLLYDHDYDYLLDLGEFSMMLRLLLSGLCLVTGEKDPTSKQFNQEIDTIVQAVVEPHSPLLVSLNSWYHYCEHYRLDIAKLAKKLKTLKTTALEDQKRAEEQEKELQKNACISNMSPNTRRASLFRARFRGVVKAVAMTLRPNLHATIDTTDILHVLNIFNDLDVDGDCKVTKQEFDKCLKAAFGRRTDSLFNNMESSSDNHLCFLEMLSYCFPRVDPRALRKAIVNASQHPSLRAQRTRLITLLLTDQQRNDIREMFTLLDKNDTGVISWKDFCVGMSDVVKLGPTEVDQLLAVDKGMAVSSGVTQDKFLDLYVRLMEGDTDFISLLLDLGVTAQALKEKDVRRQQALAATLQKLSTTLHEVTSPRAPLSPGGAMRSPRASCRVASPRRSPKGIRLEDMTEDQRKVENVKRAMAALQEAYASAEAEGPNQDEEDLRAFLLSHRIQPPNTDSQHHRDNNNKQPKAPIRMLVPHPPDSSTTNGALHNKEAPGGGDGCLIEPNTKPDESTLQSTSAFNGPNPPAAETTARGQRPQPWRRLWATAMGDSQGDD